VAAVELGRARRAPLALVARVRLDLGRATAVEPVHVEGGTTPPVTQERDPAVPYRRLDFVGARARALQTPLELRLEVVEVDLASPPAAAARVDGDGGPA